MIIHDHIWPVYPKGMQPWRNKWILFYLPQVSHRISCTALWSKAWLGEEPDADDIRDFSRYLPVPEVNLPNLCANLGVSNFRIDWSRCVAGKLASCRKGAIRVSKRTLVRAASTGCFRLRSSERLLWSRCLNQKTKWKNLVVYAVESRIIGASPPKLFGYEDEQFEILHPHAAEGPSCYYSVKSTVPESLGQCPGSTVWRRGGEIVERKLPRVAKWHELTGFLAIWGSFNCSELFWDNWWCVSVHSGTFSVEQHQSSSN